MLGLHGGSVVAADTLVELLWGEDPPRTAAKALQTHISLLRRTLGDGFVLRAGTGWTLAETQVDAARYKSAARLGRDAAAAGDTSQAVARFDEALGLWRGIPELPDSRRGASEKTRWIEGHAALVEDRADALLATGRAAEIIGELEAAVTDAPLRERRWGQLMLALYRAGRQGEALGAYQRARALLADELGVDPGPDLRRLGAAIVAQDPGLEVPATQQVSSVTRAVTFLLTDIEGSTAAWEADAAAMAVALARHDELVEQVVTSRGGRLIKTRGEGDATFSVFDRPSAAAAAAVELQDAIGHEPWELGDPMRIRVALHTGEVELRDGDYFGRAVNRAARLRSLATGGQILCSGATAELVIDSLPDDVVLADLGIRQLRNLARPEHVFELQLQTADDRAQDAATEPPLERPSLPAVFAGPGPFVGRGHEFERLSSAWQTALAGGTNAVLIAGEPGVGKTRLAGEWSRRAYDQGALVIYGRCDEDLGAPYQPFAEALRSLVPCLGTSALRGLRGVEALLPMVPGLTEVLPDLAAPTRADPDTERYALFDAVVALLGVASASLPVVLILDDLHWAAKPTLLLLRHLLRFGEHARVQIVGTYRSTDLDRSHPLAAMLADLHRDGTATRLSLSGLDEDDVTTYVAEAGYDDEELARALATVTGGNPFFLIEALRHVDESGGRWDQSTLPQGVREAVGRRLSRLAPETNKALATAAVAGSRFALELVERVVGDDLVDAFDEACKAGIVIEEPGGRYRFNHAIVRQSLLAELPSVRRMRLHQGIAATLENEPGAGDELLADLAHHYFECAWAGNAAKAVEYCRRAADQAMARLAYEGAADLYDHALHALEEIDDELPDRDDQVAELLVARCEALLAAGDVTSAAGAVSELESVPADSARIAAWATCFDGQLSMLIHPERLDEVEAELGSAAAKLAELDDAAGEAKAHTVRAGCLARLGRIGDCEIALDNALTAARRAREHRRVNAVLAGAPLAALWGPNPVPRAGGRCLDVVRLLRITTDSPAVEATSTRCQALLEAFRGRTAAARRMIDSARRTVTELGLRHALLEVEQFAGIVELIADDPGAAEPHLRKAYNGFRRMGLDADTAETAALLGRSCLALDRDAEADELCTESERLAGHALKASIAWRTLRAQLLSRGGDHDEARRVAEAAVGLAERTDLLVDHGDACLTLATVLSAAGDVKGARAAAERAVDLYERKGAAALTERARRILGAEPSPAPGPPEAPSVKPDNAAVRVGERVMAAIHRRAWDEFEQLFAPDLVVENRRKIVGLTLPSDVWRRGLRRELETGVRINHVMIAARGERLALSRLVTSNADVSPGAPYDELLQLYAIDEQGRVALQVWFDVEDMDAALTELDAAYARLEDDHPPARRLGNTASQMAERFQSHFVAGDWDAITQLLADDYSGDDRRTVVGSGFRGGRDALVEDLRAVVEVGVTKAKSNTIATRGKRLALIHAQYSGSDEQPEAFRVDFLQIVEIDAGDRILAYVAFDADDIDGALEDLDARYLAGEAAAHARTWRVVTGAYAAHNRRQVAAATPDAVSIDHRRVARFEPGQGVEYLRAGWEIDQELNIYVETVHRLSDLGAVLTWRGGGASHEGFDAEWRGINLFTVDGEMVSRGEVFDEADLDAAIAKFDQLSGPAPRLENTATRVFERLFSYVAAGDWHAVGQITADNVSVDDRRRVVNAGVLRGRDANIKDAQATADVGFTMTMVGAIAIRGERLALLRVRVSGRDPEAIQNDALNIVQIDAEQRIVGDVVFDLDDFDSAIAELDARYVAGEAAAHAQTWSAIAAAYAAITQHELPPTTPDWVNVDHRRGRAFAPGDLIPYIHATWEMAPQSRIYIEAVHRLSDRGAVVTNAMQGSSREGFDAEWREVFVLTSERDSIDRCELFDEADLEAAIARFEQLHPKEVRLTNSASQTYERMQACFVARDWNGVADTLADDIHNDDRRRVVNGGDQRGRDTAMANVRSAADLGVTHAASNVLATRGERLALTLVRFAQGDEKPEAFSADLLQLVEIDAEARIAVLVMFDFVDIDAAFEELDARYLTGEAAAHARTWSVIASVFVAHNRREMAATTPHAVSLDHRRVAAFAPGEGFDYIRAGWDLGQTINIYIETAHRANNVGAVFTWAGYGTSHEGFAAEWRGVTLITVDGEMVARMEVFDEADLDAALARFDQASRPTPRLQNAASQTYERVQACFATRDWNAISEMLADDICTDDRRRVVNAGIRRRRAPAIQDLRANAELGVSDITSIVIAMRGERLVLSRIEARGRDNRPDAFHADAFDIVEINADGMVSARVVFDLDDIDAAFEELDARYLTGEAAAHAHTWSTVMGCYAALNQREIPATTTNFVNIDHRRGTTPFAPGDVKAYTHAAWNQIPDISFRIENVHQLSHLGAVVTQVLRGTSQEGFEAEWREIHLMTVDGDLFNRSEFLDETDLDAAIARFEQLSRPAPRLENAASQVTDRFLAACFAARQWDTLPGILADNFGYEDRRRVVGAGARDGRDTYVADMRASADLWAANAPTVMAIRGERLALARLRFSGRDQGPEAFVTDVLGVAEINREERIVAVVSFDPDDFEAAIAELDARYLAGEAAAHANTWSVITQSYAALNRHEVPPTTPDWVNVDHRRGTSFASGEMPALLNAAWNLTTDLSHAIETVHRLNDFGAVVTNMSRETSHEGFDAEWRVITVGTVEGDMLSRCEVFDEADLDSALARFEELQRPSRRLENAASQVTERFLTHLASGDWDAIAETFADDFCQDDRRRVVGAGVRHGRDAEISDLRAIAGLRLKNATSTVMATRGERLALMRVRFSFREQGTEAFLGEYLGICDLNGERRVVAAVGFDPDDVDAAFTELESRYLSGQAADYSQTWSVIASSYAAFNRQEVPAAHWITIDHRRGTPFERNNMTPSIRTMWDLTPDLSIHIEAAHRLSNCGAVITHVGHATSREGFDAEWRAIDVLIVDGDVINRCEVFDEADLDAAIARFEQLSRPAPRLQNAATQVYDRVNAQFASRDWAAMAETMAQNVVDDDRRRMANSGIRTGREAVVAGVRTAAELGAQNIASTAIATRGDRLALCRLRFSGRDQRPEGFYSEALGVIEIDAEERVLTHISFDLDDIDAAFAELDARYIAREAAAYSDTWSVIAGAYAALNRHEFPATTPDWINIDHRGETAFGPDDLLAYILAGRDEFPDINIYVEAVHRLSGLGAVYSYAAHETSQEGFDAEWRGVSLLTVEGDKINRTEIFDEAGLGAAMARFEQLSRPAPQLENASSRVAGRFLAHFGARDWNAIAEMLTSDYSTEDRRRVVGAGVRHGRDAQMADMRAIADVWITSVILTVIATRGERLALTVSSYSDRDQGSDAFRTEVLAVGEVNADERIVASVSFDVDDVDAAFEELDARYLAGEAAEHAHTWSAIAEAYAGFNRREFPATTPNYADIDHRRGAGFASGDLISYVQAAWDDSPDTKIYIAAVHRLSNIGAVVTHVANGIPQEGFDAESRDVLLLTMEGNLVNRCELFDEADLDAALARFEELRPQAPRPENAASQAAEHFYASYGDRDWDAIAELLAGDSSFDDRRRVVNAGLWDGRDAVIANLRAFLTEAAPLTLRVIATRGERLALTRLRSTNSDVRHGEFKVELLSIVEIDADNQILAHIGFDVDDLNAAFDELDARYLAGEAAAYTRTWTATMQGYAALNRHEIPDIAPDIASVDHRRGIAFAPGEIIPYTQGAFDVASDIKIHIEVVHRLDNFGAVFTHAAYATSHEGFNGEWREIALLTVDGHLVNRCEMFDETDLDAALARFDELVRQARRPENAASRLDQRFWTYFAALDWNAMAELIAVDISTDDRRRVVNAGVREGRDAHIAEMRAVAEVGLENNVASTIIATRGARLALTRICSRNVGPRPEEVSAEVLNVLEIDADNCIVARVGFDVDDMDAAFQELDARYLAGEAAAHSHTWSLIARECAAFNRHELPAADWITVDHRQFAVIDAREGQAAMRDIWEVTPNLSMHIEAVHRLSSLGGVASYVASGTSPEGVDAEWPMILLLTIEGDRINRCEIFDKEDAEDALARFEELTPPMPLVENTGD